MILIGATPLIRYIVGMEKSPDKRARQREISRVWAKAHPERRRDIMAKYLAANRKKLAARTAAWRLANPGKAAAYRHSSEGKRKAEAAAAAYLPRKKVIERAYHLANREKRLAYGAEYRRLHAEELRAKHTANAERRHANWKAWATANPEKIASIAAAKRARKIGARAGCRKAYRAFVRRVQTATSIACYWCSTATRKGQRHRDHIIPLSKGGADAVENLCVSCPNCNQRKWAKTPFEFTGQGELHFA